MLNSNSIFVVTLPGYTVQKEGRHVQMVPRKHKDWNHSQRLGNLTHENRRLEGLQPLYAGKDQPVH